MTQFAEARPRSLRSIAAAAVGDGRVAVSIVDGFDRVTVCEISADKQQPKPEKVRSGSDAALKVVASSSRSLVTAERGPDELLTLKRYAYVSRHRLLFEDLDACEAAGGRLYLNRFARWFRLDALDSPLVPLDAELVALKAFRWAERNCALLVSASGVLLRDEQGAEVASRTFEAMLEVRLLDIVHVDTAGSRVALLCRGGVLVELCLSAGAEATHTLDEVDAACAAVAMLGEFYLFVAPGSPTVRVYKRDNLRRLRFDRALDLLGPVLSVDRLSERRARCRLGRAGSYDIHRELSIVARAGGLAVEQSGFKLAPVHYLGDARVELKVDHGRSARERVQFARYAVHQLADCTVLRCVLVGADADYPLTAYLHKTPIEAVESLVVTAEGRLVVVAAACGTCSLLEVAASKALDLVQQATLEGFDAVSVATDGPLSLVAVLRRDALLVLDGTLKPLKQVELACSFTDPLLFLNPDCFHQAVKSARDAHWYVDNQRLLDRNLAVVALAAHCFVALSPAAVSTHRYDSHDRISDFKPPDPLLSLCAHWSGGALHLLLSTPSRLVLAFVDAGAQVVACRQLQVSLGCLLQSSAADEFVHVLSCMPSGELVRLQVNKIHNTHQAWRGACGEARPLVQLLGEVFTVERAGLRALALARE